MAANSTLDGFDLAVFDPAVFDPVGFDLAVALEYGASRAVNAAPKIVIKGTKGETAWLIKTAQQLGIPVVEDNGAATALSEIALDSEIPEDLYRAIAVIINKLSA